MAVSPLALRRYVWRNRVMLAMLLEPSRFSEFYKKYIEGGGRLPEGTVKRDRDYLRRQGAKI